MDSDKKVLVIAHGHPDFSPGGAEIAAYSLFEGYRRHSDIGVAWLLARFEGDALEGGISRHADNEYLWEQSLGDDFYMEGRNLYSSLTIFRDFLENLKPDIVHLHHAAHMGYEILEIIRKSLPNAKICFTLHEYIPICHNSGQMIKTGGNLCMKSGLKACNQCFPKKSGEDFWLRKRRFMHYFSLVDAFFAPSEFLRQRYIDWGLPAEKIHAVENGLREIKSCHPRNLGDDDRPNRFGFFGQITKFKGLELLFQALNLMSAEDRAKIILEIHGAGFGEVAEAHEKKLRREYKKLSDEGAIRWIGPYDSSQIASRMAGLDWVVMPSIWWENSPVVIQEAFACGRPVMVSNIGGMAEKVRHGVDGIHVEAGNPQAWADALLKGAQGRALWERLRANISRPVPVDEATDKHLKIMGIC